MRRVLLLLVVLVIFGAGFLSGYLVALPPSESRACVDAIKSFDADVAQECREALEQNAPEDGIDRP
jgi:hypothetical protein